ncbi:MAG: hypothetical protein WD275_06850, partial [Rhodothermales bacterium]
MRAAALRNNRVQFYGLFLAAFSLLFAAPARSDEPGIVRVLLYDQNAPVEIAIKALGGAVHLYAADFEIELARLEDGQEAIVRRASNQLHVKIGPT